MPRIYEYPFITIYKNKLTTKDMQGRFESYDKMQQTRKPLRFCKLPRQLTNNVSVTLPITTNTFNVIF
jgi:hypothetical protein